MRLSRFSFHCYASVKYFCRSHHNCPSIAPGGQFCHQKTLTYAQSRGAIQSQIDWMGPVSLRSARLNFWVEIFVPWRSRLIIFAIIFAFRVESIYMICMPSSPVTSLLHSSLDFRFQAPLPGHWAPLEARLIFCRGSREFVKILSKIAGRKFYSASIFH